MSARLLSRNMPAKGGRTLRLRAGVVAFGLSLLLGCSGLPAVSPPTPVAPTYTNPVLDEDFPDPDVLRVGETYYMYATNAGGAQVPAASSTDLVHWAKLKDALPVLPAWAAPNNTWAPDVSALASDRYLMYFTARHAASGKQCIGAATASSPEGPFQSAAAEPFICQMTFGGSIDPASFVDDDGARYVLWKNEGNCCHLATFVYLQQTSPDGLTLVGAPRQLITADQPWERDVVEAPTLWKRNGRYYLFYSANNYDGAAYAIGYAMANAIAGPYRKPSEPLLKTSNVDGKEVIDPGGQDVVQRRDGRTWLVYHTWDASVSYRPVSIDELTWEGDTPVVRGPTRSPQPIP